jgi:hypothetical protein
MEIETTTVFYGLDEYMINSEELDSYLKQGFTKKATKAAPQTPEPEAAK